MKNYELFKDKKTVNGIYFLIVYVIFSRKKGEI